MTDVHSSFDLQSCVRVWNTSAVVCSTSCLEYVCCRELHILSGVRLLSCVARLVWNTSAVVSCTCVWNTSAVVCSTCAWITSAVVCCTCVWNTCAVVCSTCVWITSAVVSCTCVCVSVLSGICVVSQRPSCMSVGALL